MAQTDDVGDSPKALFFLGAGASVPAGIKDVVRLVDDLINWFDTHNKQHLKAAREITRVLGEWEKNRSIEDYLNIETLLETVDRLEESFGDVLPTFFKDRTLKLNKETIEIIKGKTLSKKIKEFIQVSFQDLKDLNYLYPLDDFISNNKPLYVFTTNYDLTMERVCDNLKKKYTDLFNGNEWSPETVDLLKFDLTLHKLHGSINWYRTEKGKYIKSLAKTTDLKIELHTNENAVPLILYPGKKLEYIEPTLEMLNILKKSLLNVKYCFIIGYAFKDEHILKLFLYAANKNPELVLFLISPSAHAIYYEKLKSHSDREFPHSFTHESFDASSFNVTVPSGLEGRVIRLPYKIQNIFPKLSEYHKSLRKGENLERAFKIYEGKIDPLAGIVSGESSLRLVDCLKYYSDCEYFEKIDEIIMVKTGGWDSIIDKMAQTNYSRNEIIIILDIFLKSFFNYSSSSNKQAMSDRFTKYLRMMKKVKIEIKNFFIQSYFQLANVNIPSYLGYKWHQILESHYFEYQKIAEIKEDYILKNIQDGKKFFEKWKDGEIAFDCYVNNHVVDESKQEKLVEIKNKLLLTHSIEEAKALQDQVCDIINNIENPCE